MRLNLRGFGVGHFRAPMSNWPDADERPAKGDRLRVTRVGEVALEGRGYLPPGLYMVERVERTVVTLAPVSESLSAVDLDKRCDDLRRFAAEGSGASANERAIALRELARLGCSSSARVSSARPAPGPRRPASRGMPPWATDPRDFTDIYRNDLADINFAKKTIYEHALRSDMGKPHKFYLAGFDGNYMRSSFYAMTTEYDLDFAAHVLEQWDARGPLHFTNRDGHFEAVIAQVPGIKAYWIVRIRGRDVSKQALVVQHDSDFDGRPHALARALNAVIARSTR